MIFLKGINKIIKLDDNYTKILLLNETGSDINTKETLTLDNFFDKYYTQITLEIFLHILFQIVYTLTCFDQIKLQHFDLHLGNILVFIRHTNILDNPDFFLFLFYFLI